MVMDIFLKVKRLDVINGNAFLMKHLFLLQLNFHLTYMHLFKQESGLIDFKFVSVFIQFVFYVINKIVLE